MIPGCFVFYFLVALLRTSVMDRRFAERVFTMCVLVLRFLLKTDMRRSRPSQDYKSSFYAARRDDDYYDA